MISFVKGENGDFPCPSRKPPVACFFTPFPAVQSFFALSYWVNLAIRRPDIHLRYQVFEAVLRAENGPFNKARRRRAPEDHEPFPFRPLPKLEFGSTLRPRNTSTVVQSLTHAVPISARTGGKIVR